MTKINILYIIGIQGDSSGSSLLTLIGEFFLKILIYLIQNSNEYTVYNSLSVIKIFMQRIVYVRKIDITKI